MSTAALVGLAIGAVLGGLNYMLLGQLAGRVEMAETRRVLRLVALIDLVVLPVAGYLIGAYVWS